MANIGKPPPYRLTVYDYWSVTTESTEADVWNYTWGLLGDVLSSCHAIEYIHCLGGPPAGVVLDNLSNFALSC